MSTSNLQEAQNTLPRELAQSKRRIVVADGAQTLTTAQSGALCLFNTAAGFTFTLPVITSNSVGTWFEFLCTALNTSVVAKVITDSAATFILGEVIIASGGTPGSTTGPIGFAADGSTHRAINQGGANTTTGGVIGSRFSLVAISPTQWAITDCYLLGTASVATPIATS